MITEEAKQYLEYTEKKEFGGIRPSVKACRIITELIAEVERLQQEANNLRGALSNSEDEGMRWKDKAEKPEATITERVYIIVELRSLLEKAEAEVERLRAEPAKETGVAP